MQVLLWHTIGFVLGFLPSEVRGSDCWMVLMLEFVDVDYHLSVSKLQACFLTAYKPNQYARFLDDYCNEQK